MPAISAALRVADIGVRLGSGDAGAVVGHVSSPSGLGELVGSVGVSCGQRESRGMPTSRSFWSSPCSAAWSTTGPRMAVVPSAASVSMVSPSNHADQRGARRPLTRIS